MKRFWLVMMSLGLMVAFSTQAMAADVKFSGEYYAAGMYLDRTSLQKDGGPSTAFYYQRLRVRTDFIVSPGLKLITRADIMERAWGAARSATGTGLDTGSAGTRAENENIAFDWAYIDYKSPIGTFLVGYMNYGSTGTIFGNNSAPQARIRFIRPVGPIMMYASMSKVRENSRTAINPVPPATAAYADSDNDVYHLEGVYTWKGGKAGLNVNYYNYRANRPAATSNKSNYYLFTPYAIAKIGPVALQAEINYAYGEQKYEDGAFAPGTTSDKVDLTGLSAWIDATADFKMFYIGGSIAYVSGDDPYTRDKNEGQTVTGGIDWDPCLIMFNGDRNYWAGDLRGYDYAGTGVNSINTTSNGGAMTNAYFAQIRGGVRPTEKFDIMASLSWAYADKTATGATWEGRDYGYEIDLTGTYKITNNLSYMLGGGYWMVGKYYKGTTAVNQDIENDFLVINKLTLTF